MQDEHRCIFFREMVVVLLAPKGFWIHRLMPKFALCCAKLQALSVVTRLPQRTCLVYVPPQFQVPICTSQNIEETVIAYEEDSFLSSGWNIQRCSWTPDKQ